MDLLLAIVVSDTSVMAIEIMNAQYALDRFC